MNLFDLHCDTAGECYLQGKPLYKNDLHVSVCKAKNLYKWAQLFAIWIPDEKRGPAAEEYFDCVCANFLKEVEKNSDKIILCRTAEDMDNAFANGRCAALLSVEGASAALGKERLQRLKRIGVKLITLTWNGNNEIADGCFGDNGGLTAYGREYIDELSRLNIVTDVSHIGKKGFWQVAENSALSVVASHSCASKLLESCAPFKGKENAIRRNLDDEQIKALASRESLIGINFCSRFLGGKGNDGFDAVYRHMSRILDLGGKNVLALGSDFDGCEINPDLAGVDKMPALAEYLSARGFSDELVENIFFNNAYNFFKNILQKEKSVL